MSVKVAVRCRPFSSSEKEDGEENVFLVREKSLDAHYAGHTYSFCYDEVLNSAGRGEHTATQQSVFEAVAAPLLGHVITGYNGCIFAYGQTGSGKTYSMVGTEESPGLIPRITKALFDGIPDLQQQGIETCVEVSFFEIYNERVRCLLRPTEKGFDDSALRVREHPKFGPFIEGLAKFVVTAKEDCLRLLDDGNKVRSTASTAMNATSSRSHAVFTIMLTQTKTSDSLVIKTVSKLNLVDLAGSERASRTLATGKRLAEGSTINKSLTCLGKVISSLAELSEQSGQKVRHIPYRDSTLTWILKDNLGGNSKTVMLATVSPAAVQFDETLSTLRYAERAKKIVNTAVVNESNNNEVIAALQKEIETLTTALKTAATKDRASLLEEIMASEAMKKELNRTAEEKLAETNIMMEEREGYMRELEGRLETQKAEITALRTANAEKEKCILELLNAINKKDFTEGNLDTLRIMVAQLEMEQKATKAEIHTKVGSDHAFSPRHTYEDQSSDELSLDIDLDDDDIVDKDHISVEWSDDSLDIDSELDQLMADKAEEAAAAAPADDSLVVSLGSTLVLDDESLKLPSSSESDVINLDEWEDDDASSQAQPQVPVPVEPEHVGDDSISVPQYSIQSDALANNAYLDKQIPAVVSFGTVNYGMCLVECNFFEHSVKFLTKYGSPLDTFSSSQLLRVELDAADSYAIHIWFAGALREYTCQFESSSDRMLVHQLLLLMLPNTILFSPSLCSLSVENEMTLTVHGTKICRGSVDVKVSDRATFSLAKMPYEVYNFWYGCFSLDQLQFPVSSAVLNGFLPSVARDLYVIGVLDVPAPLCASSAVADLFLNHLGKDTFQLFGSSMEGSAEEEGSPCAVIVICRSVMFHRLSTLRFMPYSPQQYSSFTGISCSLNLNQSSLLFLLVNAPEHEQMAPKARNASIRSMLSSYSFGNTAEDISTRYDYLFVSGRFNYGNQFKEKDDLKRHMKANNLLSDFVEQPPSGALRSVQHPCRILTLCQPYGAHLELSDYSTSRVIPSSAFIEGDIFSRRHFLSVFAKVNEPLCVSLENIVLKCRRLPSQVRNPSISVAGFIVQDSPRKESCDSLETVNVSLMVPLLTTCLEVAELQTLSFTILGEIDGANKVIPIASGLLPLKPSVKHFNETYMCKVSLYHATCFMGLMQCHVKLHTRGV